MIHEDKSVYQLFYTHGLVKIILAYVETRQELTLVDFSESSSP